MALPEAGGQAFKLAGSQVLPVADLGLPSIYPSNSSASGTFHMGVPGVVMVIGQTASGTNVVKVAAAASSGAITYAGAASATFNTTTIQDLIFFTTSASPWVGVLMQDSGTGSTFTSTQGVFTVLCLYVCTAGENWHTVSAGYLATASKLRGDGQGYTSTSQFVVQ